MTVDLTVTELSLRLCATDREALARLVAETGVTENMAIQTAIQNESMNTDARRKASAAFHAKRKAEGWRKVTLWMHPDTVEDLDRLAKVYDGRERAVAMCLNHHTHPDVRRHQLEEEEARKG